MGTQALYIFDDLSSGVFYRPDDTHARTEVVVEVLLKGRVRDVETHQTAVCPPYVQHMQGEQTALKLRDAPALDVIRMEQKVQLGLFFGLVVIETPAAFADPLSR
jgi:hypothetical protein